MVKASLKDDTSYEVDALPTKPPTLDDWFKDYCKVIILFEVIIVSVIIVLLAFLQLSA